MPLFWKPYKSDITNFLDELKARKPNLEEEQRAGRALLWDRSIDPEWQAEFEAGKLRQPAYVYQAKTS
ncbi:MAG TPA: DUF3460 family protein [Burkholderiaceae bacterium]|nr:DUF3460 family protein [Burkholderiaceae bacterium]